MTTAQHDFIDLSIKHDALRFGEFTLKSGRKSPYFFNMGNLNTGKALELLGEFYAKTIIDNHLEFDMLFGAAYKGIPLVTATVMALYRLYHREVPYAFNRKEAKNHGEKGMLIGAPLKGRVLVIDDVLTAGTAFRETAALCKANQATLAGFVLAFNRQEKIETGKTASDIISEEFHIPVKSIITLDDLMAYLKADSVHQDTVNLLENYIKDMA